MTIVLAVWGASAIIGVSIYLVMTKRHKDKIVYPCDSCARLEEKHQKTLGYYRYICKKRGGFDKPLEYCDEYTPLNEYTSGLREWP